MTKKHDFDFSIDLDRSFWRSVEPAQLFEYPMRRLTAAHDPAPQGVEVNLVKVGFGMRKVFVCPHCQKPKRDLFAYESGSVWWCRDCAGLRYGSARTGRTKRDFQVALNDRQRVLKRSPHASIHRRSGSWRKAHEAAKRQHHEAELRAMLAFMLDCTTASERRLASMLRDRRGLERALGSEQYLELINLAGEALRSSLDGLRACYGRLRPEDRTDEIGELECRVISLESRRKTITQQLTNKRRAA